MMSPLATPDESAVCSCLKKSGKSYELQRFVEQSFRLQMVKVVRIVAYGERFAQNRSSMADIDCQIGGLSSTERRLFFQQSTGHRGKKNMALAIEASAFDSE
jgi:hypothetical protein